MRDRTTNDGCEILRHPLRGLASDGAEPAVREALEELDGILAIEVSVGHAIATVTFDPGRVTAEQVRARLQMAGVRKNVIEGGDGEEER